MSSYRFTPFDSPSDSSTPFYFDGRDSSTPDSFDSTVKSVADSYGAAVMVSVVISSIATIAIVIAIIYCLKKTAESAHTYARLTSGQDDKELGDHQSSNAELYPVDHPNMAVVTNSQLMEAATMERFLSDMAKEKPLRFSSHQLRELTHNFSTRLGSGGFGVVYKGDLPNGIPIAVKVLNSNLGKRVEEQFMAEVATIGRTYHINLVRLYGFCFDNTLQALVYEYMENGSLDTLLFNGGGTILSWKKLHEIAVGTAKGIAYLHEECQHRIIHYDIKPENVLLDSNLSPKVADFGLAKLCNRDNTHVEWSGLKGTPGYAAPEVWMPSYPVTHKCDVYSFGMLLFEIVGRRRNRLGGEMSGTSKEWLPRWVYEKAVERKEVVEMLAELGVIEANSSEEREAAERAAMVALWCVQYLPTARPNMSDVVRMLEGGAGIPQPPNPFAHLVDASAGGGGGGSFGSTTWESSSAATNPTFPHIYEERIDIVAVELARLDPNRET